MLATPGNLLQMQFCATLHLWRGENGMGAESRFTHVKGPKRTFESICMACLLTVGICRSEQDLVAKENEHACKGRSEETGESN
jgi:hypothetical protein